MYRLAVAPFENEAFQIGNGVAPPEGGSVLPPSDIDGAAGDIFRATDLPRHLRNLDAELRRADWIKHYVQFVGPAVAVDLRAADTRNSLKPRDHHILQELLIVIDVMFVAGQLLHE